MTEQSRISDERLISLAEDFEQHGSWSDEELEKKHSADTAAALRELVLMREALKFCLRHGVRYETREYFSRPPAFRRADNNASWDLTEIPDHLRPILLAAVRSES